MSIIDSPLFCAGLIITACLVLTLVLSIQISYTRRALEDTIDAGIDAAVTLFAKAHELEMYPVHEVNLDPVAPFGWDNEMPFNLVDERPPSERHVSKTGYASTVSRIHLHSVPPVDAVD